MKNLKDLSDIELLDVMCSKLNSASSIHERNGITKAYREVNDDYKDARAELESRLKNVSLPAISPITKEVIEGWAEERYSLEDIPHESLVGDSLRDGFIAGCEKILPLIAVYAVEFNTFIYNHKHDFFFNKDSDTWCGVDENENEYEITTDELFSLFLKEEGVDLSLIEKP